MRYVCYFCHKSVTSELLNDSVIRAALVCPECLDEGKILFRTDEEITARKGLQENILTGQLLDLITLMPDSQTQEIVDYIMSLREIRKKMKE